MSFNDLICHFSIIVIRDEKISDHTNIEFSEIFSLQETKQKLIKSDQV